MTKKGVTSTVYDLTPQVLKNLEKLQLEYLVAIGGDDTLSYAAKLDQAGFKVIAIPKTMDNDVRKPSTASVFPPPFRVRRRP